MATFVCLVENHAKFKYMAAGSIFSCVFLLITILVYLCIPKLCNLHGKTLLGNVISSFVAGCSLSFVQLETKDLHLLCRFLCKFITPHNYCGLQKKFFKFHSVSHLLQLYLRIFLAQYYVYRYLS